MNLAKALEILQTCNASVVMKQGLAFDVSDCKVKYTTTPTSIGNSVFELLAGKTANLIDLDNDAVPNGLELFVFHCMQDSLKAGPEIAIGYVVPDRLRNYKPLDNKLYFKQVEAENVYRKNYEMYGMKAVAKPVSIKVVRINNKWHKLNVLPYTS